MSPPIRAALREYRQELERTLPGRVRRVTLFGSVARGQANEDSDVDVLVVVDDPAFSERSRAVDQAAEIGLRRDLVLAPLVLGTTEWADLVQRERALAREIERDGIEA
jgi:uncharacterized protein